MQLSFSQDNTLKLQENLAFDLDILWDEQQFFSFEPQDI
jgi:hypothetical protein